MSGVHESAVGRSEDGIFAPLLVVHYMTSDYIFIIITRNQYCTESPFNDSECGLPIISNTLEV